MIRVLIIDDESLARSIVKEYLAVYEGVTVVQECNDGFEGVKAIMQYRPDLIFLDIQMPKINGFEMLELLENPPAVVFTTAFDEYAIRAFEAQAVDYLLKPFSKDRFDKAFQKWLVAFQNEQQLVSPIKAISEQLQVNTNRVVVKTGGKIKIIPFADIHFIEAADDYVKIHCEEGAFLKNKTMAYFEQALDSNSFSRSHRSYIVNVQKITRLEPYEKEGYLAVLESGTKVPVSKTGYTRLKQVLGL